LEPLLVGDLCWRVARVLAVSALLGREPAVGYRNVVVGKGDRRYEYTYLRARWGDREIHIGRVPKELVEPFLKGDARDWVTKVFELLGGWPESLDDAVEALLLLAKPGWSEERKREVEGLLRSPVRPGWFDPLEVLKHLRAAGGGAEEKSW